MPALCRDCALETDGGTCRACGSRRVVQHPDLFDLAIAHVDCDAFYASVEKRDRPELAGCPVIIGGGTRGVVTTACYIARLYGVHSAQPMFKALKLCPDAVIIRPDFTKYSEAARHIRALMSNLTPLMQPLSIDEAVLDLSGTAALHAAPPAAVLARFAQRVETEIGITVSIGLAANRLLAKIAAGRDKPRGFSVLGRDAAAVLASEPVALLPGVGPVLERKLHARGITHLGHLQALDDRTARDRLGDDGPALVARARGEDVRLVHTDHASKSVSAETTFDTDIADRAGLERHLWRMVEKLGRRLREQDLAAGGVVLKLKTAGFASRTRNARLSGPTQLPEMLFAAARALLHRETDGTAFRLIGIGANPLLPAAGADQGDLADPDAAKRQARWQAVETLRAKFGDAAIVSGRSLPVAKGEPVAKR